MDKRTQQNKDFFNSLAKDWDAKQKLSEDGVFNLVKLANINPGDKVLDVACGTGIIDKHLLKLGAKNVVAIDLSENMIAIAKSKNSDENLRYEIADFYDFSEGDFDKIVIYNAYPHFTDTQAFLTAINNNLKKGGEFSIIHSDPPSVINARHSGVAKIVSKDLESADEEANIFKELFDIVQTVDDGEKYLVRGKKKIMKDDEKRGETPRFLLCFAFLHASTSILRGFYDKDSLPGDCHVARHKLHF